MRASISARDRRTLAVGVAVIASLLVVAYGLPRYRTWRGAAMLEAERETSALVQQEASVARFNATAAALATLHPALTVLDSTLLTGASVSAAGTSLAAAISEAAEGAGAELGSIQMRRDSTGRSRLTRIGAHATVSGDVESLALFLESLEADVPLLAVREWSISGGSSAIAPTQPTVLRMEVLVEGLARTPRVVRSQ